MLPLRFSHNGMAEGALLGLVPHRSVSFSPGLGLGEAQCSFIAAIVFVAVDMQDCLAGARQSSSARPKLVSLSLMPTIGRTYSASSDCGRPVPEMSTSQLVPLRVSMLMQYL